MILHLALSKQNENPMTLSKSVVASEEWAGQRNVSPFFAVRAGHASARASGPISQSRAYKSSEYGYIRVVIRK